MDKIYIWQTENIPLISKFKKYSPELERVTEFIFNYYLHTFIHNLIYLESGHKTVLTANYTSSQNHF